MRRTAINQLYAKLGFQPLESLTDRRLTPHQAFGGKGDTAFLHNKHEGAQQVQVQRADQLFLLKRVSH